MKRFVITALSALAVACSAAPSEDIGTSTQDLSEEIPQHVLHNKATNGGSSANNLVDHGGRVLPAANVYAIWWGMQSAFPSDAKAGIDSLFKGLSGTSFLGIANQYMRGASTTVTFKGNLTDSSSYPPWNSPKTSTITNEACRAIRNNGLAPDPTAIYFVFASNMPHENSYCAWHSYGYCNGVTIQVAYMPNIDGVAGCDLFDVTNLSCNSYSEGTAALANVTSHELMEALTDADISAWYDGSGSEIGDKCAWQFSSCVNLSTGPFQLQQEWSNTASGCVQQ
jgi:hypothetical protein